MNWGFCEAIRYYMKNPYKDYDYNTYVNKHKVKNFVKDIINVSKEYAYFTTPEKIDNYNFNSLLNSFVIKGVHGCGYTEKVKERGDLDKEEIVEIMKGWLGKRYNIEVEKHYAQVVPGVIIEEYLGDNINDYKFFMFSGEIGFIQLDIDRVEGHKQNFHDKDWNLLPFKRRSFHNDFSPRSEKPDNLEEMINTVYRLTEKAHNPPFVRVDLYNIDDRLYFGEYTFTPDAGTNLIRPMKYEKKYGALIKKI